MTRHYKWWPVAVASLASACGQTPAVEVFTSLDEDPRDVDFDVLGVVVEPEAGGFTIGGAAPVRTCDVVLAESARGIVGQVSFDDGSVHIANERRPEMPLTPALSSLGSHAAYWSSWPHLLTVVDRDLEHVKVELPEHPWGGRFAGPVFDLGSPGIAMVPLGSSRPVVASPEPWIDAPLFLLASDSLSQWNPGGALSPRGGKWLTWFGNRAFLGSTGDTILALMANTGTLRRYHHGPNPAPVLVRVDTLIRLVPYVEPREHTRETLLEGGGRRRMVGFHQVRTAAFLPDGSFLAVRPASVERQPFRDPDFGWIQRWTVTEFVLEYYSADARRRGRVPLEADALFALRAVPNGPEIAALFPDSVLILARQGAPLDRCWGESVNRIQLPRLLHQEPE